MQYSVLFSTAGSLTLHFKGQMFVLEVLSQLSKHFLLSIMSFMTPISAISSLITRIHRLLYHFYRHGWKFGFQVCSCLYEWRKLALLYYVCYLFHLLYSSKCLLSFHAQTLLFLVSNSLNTFRRVFFSFSPTSFFFRILWKTYIVRAFIGRFLDYSAWFWLSWVIILIIKNICI